MSCMNLHSWLRSHFLVFFWLFCFCCCFGWLLVFGCLFFLCWVCFFVLWFVLCFCFSCWDCILDCVGPLPVLLGGSHEGVGRKKNLVVVRFCVKILMNPQLSSASSKSFSRRQQTGHTRHKTKSLEFSCYSSHSLVEQHKVTQTSQKQKTAVPTADSRSKVVSDNILRNNQRFRPNV